MFMKVLGTAARVAVTTHKLVSAMGATIFVVHALYSLYQHGQRRPRKRK